MFQTFATVASSLYFIGYTLFVGGLMYTFSQLSYPDQRRASINLSPLGVFIYLAAIAWLITVLVS